jgi:8-oxo-dGTP diphosphatase
MNTLRHAHIAETGALFDRLTPQNSRPGGFRRLARNGPFTVAGSRAPSRRETGAGGGAMQGDGNGWARCGLGHRHWGRFGAAGLLLTRTRGGSTEILLQHRAAWTSDGNTWAIPGGARDSHETPAQGALREAAEEAGIVAADVEVVGLWHDDHDGWEYVTVVAMSLARVTLRANAESAELRWVRPEAVADLPLHTGFARTWPAVRRTYLPA